jgi:hypothetical protein
MWVGLTAHNIHQFCVRVVPAEDGQVMPEECRDIEHQQSVSENEVCIKLVVLLHNYVTMMHGKQHFKFSYPPYCDIKNRTDSEHMPRFLVRGL